MKRELLDCCVDKERLTILVEMRNEADNRQLDCLGHAVGVGVTAGIENRDGIDDSLCWRPGLAEGRPDEWRQRELVDLHCRGIDALRLAASIHIGNGIDADERSARQANVSEGGEWNALPEHPVWEAIERELPLLLNQ